MSIQSETYSPDHMSSERQLWVQWTIGAAAIFVSCLVIGLALSPLVYWASQQSFNVSSWAIVKDYLARALNPEFVLHAHRAIMRITVMGGIINIGATILIALFISAIFYAACPYQSFDATHGKVTWATNKDMGTLGLRLR